MSVWYAIPSARSAAEAEPQLAKWRSMGYRMALWRELDADPIQCDFTLSAAAYPGYHVATNKLCQEILSMDSAANWIVIGGDDMDPDPTKPPEEIAAECNEHFGGTWGVMQPTGDRWSFDGRHVCSEMVAGSPFIGREWCRRMYGGEGPLFKGYWHFFGDEEMQELAIKYGIFWQRRDLSHHHHHAMRKGGRKAIPQSRNNGAMFRQMEAIFKQRRAMGFPGHEPLA